MMLEARSSLPCLNTNFKQLLKMFTINKYDQNCEQILKFIGPVANY